VKLAWPAISTNAYPALALFVTQPALTSRIRRLEQELGAALFVRDRRGARLTDAGRAFLPYAQQAAATMMEAQRAVSLVVSGMTGDLVIRAINDRGLPPTGGNPP
jgi:DNA-binding transcriptional LysR family regulator